MRSNALVVLCVVSLAACAREPVEPQPTPTPAAPQAPENDTKAARVDEAKPAAPGDAPAPPPAEAPPVAAEISDTRALVLNGDALVRLAPSGKTEPVIAVPKVQSCQVDDDYRVVWLVTDTELFAWDPADPKLQKVATGFAAPADGVVWQVQRAEPPSPFPVATAGNADGLEHCVALVIEMGTEPGVGGEAVAEGDREFYCFEEDTIGSSAPKLQAEEARVDAGYDAARLVGKALLVALEARRKAEGTRTRPPLNAPAAPKVTIDRARCEEDPEACGTAEYVGGDRLWWIVTDNSRGDFFHQTRQLYDSKASTFWNPATDTRDAEPGEGDELARLHASPDGTWGIHGDEILSLAEAKATGAFTGSFCGWQ